MTDANTIIILALYKNKARGTTVTTAEASLYSALSARSFAWGARVKIGAESAPKHVPWTASLILIYYGYTHVHKIE